MKPNDPSLVNYCDISRIMMHDYTLLFVNLFTAAKVVHLPFHYRTYIYTASAMTTSASAIVAFKVTVVITLLLRP